MPLALSREEFNSEFGGESELVEFKTGTSGRAIQDSVVALSNRDGGVILVGVGDDGSVPGRPLDAGAADALHQTLAEVHDPGRYELYPLDVDGVGVSVVSIAKREHGFAQTSRGLVLVRRGTQDAPLFGAELQAFINTRSIPRFEDTPTGVPLREADEALLAELAGYFGWDHEGDWAGRLREAGLASDEQLTIAGALYLLPDPAQRLGKSYIEVVRYPSDDATEYDRRDEIRGPLYLQLQTAVDRISSDLGTELVVLGVRRYELPRLPQVVLRECLANALAHRSYELNGTAVRVELRPGSVRVISPGGLPEPVTVQNIRETSAARNLSVIKVLRRLGLAEDAGRGINVMQDTMRQEMLEQPAFIDHGHSVEALLPIRTAVAPVERAWVRELENRGELVGPDRIILVHAARGEALTNARVRALLSVDADVAREVLQRLRDGGFLEQHGERGGATYTISGSLHPPAGLRLTPDELEGLVENLAVAGPISNRAVRDATGLDRIQSLAILERLVQQQRLIRQGGGRGTRYELPR